MDRALVDRNDGGQASALRLVTEALPTLQAALHNKPIKTSANLRVCRMVTCTSFMYVTVVGPDVGEKE